MLFGVPEYNLSIAGTLKNAYDWVSRDGPNKDCPLIKKPVAMASMAGGMGGTNAQAHFRQSLGFRTKLVFEPSEEHKLTVNRFIPGVLDKDGNLVSEDVAIKIRGFLD